MNRSVSFLTVFLSAFLLFQIQPLIAKYFLPWFGGVPAVWTTCMLFFQVLLLAGYGYVHWLVRHRSAHDQGRWHPILLVLSVVLIVGLIWRWGTPLLPGSAWKPPDGANPVGRLLWLLLLGVGLPYFLLSTTGPLLQAWFSAARPGRSPYWLYALSNAGSLTALVTYPFVVEPLCTLRTQAWLWAGGYALFVTGCVVCARSAGSPIATMELPADGEVVSLAPVPSPSRHIRLLWLGLAGVPSLMMLATTNQICQEIGVIPFFWILPLGLYLLTFVICFGRERWYVRNLALFVLMLVLVLAGVVLRRGYGITATRYILAASITLFVICMTCHGELVRLKPAPQHLTEFYGMLALGGAVGGVFVGLLAPALFKGPWEYHAGLLLGGLLPVLAIKADRASWLNRRLVYRWAVGAGLLILGLFLFRQILDAQSDTVYSTRNFYGTLRVKEQNRADPGRRRFKLYNGATLHGFQLTAPDKRQLPLAYYYPDSGIGLAFANLPDNMQWRPRQIGVIGLGTGTMAIYGKEGDSLRFYEINPAVIALARGQGGYFSYLQDTAARVEIVQGDARLALARELQHGDAAPFDVLVVDAFSGDSIPIHLLTREAWAIYLRRLQPGGVLALHISNRYLDLWPVSARLAKEFGLGAVLIAVKSDPANFRHATYWVLASRDREFMAQPAIANAASRGRARLPSAAWTDQFSDLLKVLN